METQSTKLPEEVMMLIYELRHLQNQLTTHLNQFYPGVKVTLKAANINLNIRLPNEILIGIYENRTYVITPTGLQEYSKIDNDREQIIPLDDVMIQAKFQTTKK